MQKISFSFSLSLFLLVACNSSTTRIEPDITEMNVMSEAEVRDFDDPSKGNCPGDMVGIQQTTCKISPSQCLAKTKDGICKKYGVYTCPAYGEKISFCMDRKPSLNCEAQGKRQCAASELLQACRGPNYYPIPYMDGREYDPRVCINRLNPLCRSTYGIVGLVQGNKNECDHDILTDRCCANMP